MAQGLRKIDPLVFDENIADNWTKFEREWHIYRNAGLSAATKKVQAYTFLNLAGPDAQDKYDTFTFEEGEDPEDSEELVKKFEEICLPVKNVIMDRHAFNTMNQKPHEMIQSYVATLKTLARKCEFGTLHDDLIRDRLVCGIHNDNIRTQLLKEKNLTLSSAIEICMLHEQSEKGNKEIKKEAVIKELTKESEVCAVQYFTCSNCGGQHSSDRSSCPAFNKRCNACGKWNHFSKCCRSSKTRTYNRLGQGPSPSSRAPHTIRRGGQTQRISELDAQIAYEPADLFYCESVEVPADRGEIFTILSTSNTGQCCELGSSKV